MSTASLSLCEVKLMTWHGRQGHCEILLESGAADMHTPSEAQGPRDKGRTTDGVVESYQRALHSLGPCTHHELHSARKARCRKTRI